MGVLTDRHPSATALSLIVEFASKARSDGPSSETSALPLIIEFTSETWSDEPSSETSWE